MHVFKVFSSIKYYFLVRSYSEMVTKPYKKKSSKRLANPVFSKIVNTYIVF